MTERTVQYAFVAGELSPTLYARTDLEKYDFGLRECYNMFIDYRGGASSRAGLEYAAELQNPTLNHRCFRFNFGIDVSNTYQLIFGPNTLRFVQDGAYVIESSKTITNITQADPGVVTTSAAHGYSDDDLVYIADVNGMGEVNFRLFTVDVLTTTTFRLLDVADDENIDTTGYTAYSSGGTVARVYTVATPYGSSDLELLTVEQRRDTVPPYPPRLQTARVGAK